MFGFRVNRCPLAVLWVFISALRWLDAASTWDFASALGLNLRSSGTKKHLMKLDAINFAVNQWGEQHISL